MKGTITLTIQKENHEDNADVRAEVDVVGLDAAGATVLIRTLCDALELGPTKRAVILHLIASGELDAEAGANKERVECGG